MVRVTKILCTLVALFIALYDLFVVATTHSIVGSVSAWFASFSPYFFPVFGLSFLVGHFFSEKTEAGTKFVKMVRWKFYLTAVVIVTTLVDIITIQFFNEKLALSNLLPSFPPFPVAMVGMICGKYLGTINMVKKNESK